MLQEDEISMDVRDKSAYVLRCLKVVYDSSSEVFFMAISLIDRFLTKMKAKQRYMACISVSAFYIASTSHQMVIDPEHLVSVSQCRCTADDLRRMSVVIQNKLEWAPGTQPITTLTFLRLFNNMFHAAATQLHLGDLYASLVTVNAFLLNLFAQNYGGGVIRDLTAVQITYLEASSFVSGIWPGSQVGNGGLRW